MMYHICYSSSYCHSCMNSSSQNLSRIHSCSNATSLSYHLQCWSCQTPTQKLYLNCRSFLEPEIVYGPDSHHCLPLEGLRDFMFHLLSSHLRICSSFDELVYSVSLEAYDSLNGYLRKRYLGSLFQYLWLMYHQFSWWLSAWPMTMY